MAKRCERCLTAFDDVTQTCPYCGSNTEQDHRSLEELSGDGYLVSCRLLSHTGRYVPQENAKSAGKTPRNNSTVEHTHAHNSPATSHAVRTSIEPVHIDVDDELERLRRGYEMSVTAIEASGHAHEAENTQQSSGHVNQLGTSAVPPVTCVVEPLATRPVDELIESLRVDIPHSEPEGYSDATALTHQEEADTTVRHPPIASDEVEWDEIETLRGIRERADREYRRTARREAFVGFLRDLTTPGTVPYWIGAAFLLILCVWFFIVYVFPAMVDAVTVTIESLFQYLIVIGLLLYIYRLLIHP